MKTSNRAILSVVALSLTAAMSGAALAQSLETRFNAYDLAGEPSTTAPTGQAGRAGPDAVPRGTSGRDASTAPIEVQHSAYQLATELSVAPLTGQAGRPGPASIAAASARAAVPAEIRFSIIDLPGQ